MDNLLMKHHEKLNEFTMEIKEFYMNTMMRINDPNVDGEIKILNKIVGRLTNEVSKLKEEKKQVIKEYNNRELEFEMMKMELRKIRQELGVCRKGGNGHVRNIVKMLSVTYPEDYHYTKGDVGGVEKIEEEGFLNSISDEIESKKPQKKRNYSNRSNKRKTNKRKRVVRRKKEKSSSLIDEEETINKKINKRRRRKIVIDD